MRSGKSSCRRNHSPILAPENAGRTAVRPTDERQVISTRGCAGVLFESRHWPRTNGFGGLALYGWLKKFSWQQTHQHGDVGWVLGGSPISYREIEEETGFNPRTLERWMQGLWKHGYIETEAVPAGVIVRITKAKKFPQGARKSADPARRICVGTSPQRSGASRPHPAC